MSALITDTTEPKGLSNGFKLRVDLDNADAALKDKAFLPFRTLLVKLVFPDIPLAAVLDRWKCLYINPFCISWPWGRS